MFRFSIRELILVTLVAIFGVAWFVEHRQAHASLIRAEQAEEDSKESAVGRYDCEEMRITQIKALTDQLPKYGLDFYWNDGSPMVYRPDSPRPVTYQPKK